MVHICKQSILLIVVILECSNVLTVSYNSVDGLANIIDFMKETYYTKKTRKPTKDAELENTKPALRTIGKIEQSSNTDTTEGTSSWNGEMTSTNGAFWYDWNDANDETSYTENIATTNAIWNTLSWRYKMEAITWSTESSVKNTAVMNSEAGNNISTLAAKVARSQSEFHYFVIGITVIFIAVLVLCLSVLKIWH